ncbi:MAG: phage/plasmid primase, P4 family [Anaerolineales bacterium]
MDKNNHTTSSTKTQRKFTHKGTKGKVAKPTDPELAERWIKQYPNTVYGLGCFRRYAQDTLGVWSEISPTQVEQEVTKILEKARDEGCRPTSSQLHSVIGFCRIKTNRATEHFDSDPWRVAFQNCTLDLDTGTMILPLPSSDIQPQILNRSRFDNFITTALPYDYDPDAVAENWLRVISRLSPDEQNLIQEYFGYCLTQETKHELFLWLIGLAGCGKSVFIEGFKTMLGNKAAQLGLTDLERSKFAMSIVVGKTGLYSAEQFTNNPTTLDFLNKMVSGETVTLEKKNKDHFEYTPHAKFFWASTSLPSSIPPDSGFFRRIKVVEVPPLPEDQKDLNLKNLIKKEGAGIFNWAHEGYRRLQKRGHFLIPADVKDVTACYKRENDTVQNFLDAECEIGAGLQTQAGPLSDAYRSYCFRNGMKPISPQALAKEWKGGGFNWTTINGRNYWRGVQHIPSREAIGQEFTSENLSKEKEKEKYIFN